MTKTYKKTKIKKSKNTNVESNKFITMKFNVRSWSNLLEKNFFFVTRKGEDIKKNQERNRKRPARKIIVLFFFFVFFFFFCI